MAVPNTNTVVPYTNQEDVQPAGEKVPDVAEQIILNGCEEV